MIWIWVPVQSVLLLVMHGALKRWTWTINLLNSEYSPNIHSKVLERNFNSEKARRYNKNELMIIDCFCVVCLSNVLCTMSCLVCHECCPHYLHLCLGKLAGLLVLRSLPHFLLELSTNLRRSSTIKHKAPTNLTNPPLWSFGLHPNFTSTYFVVFRLGL